MVHYLLPTNKTQIVRKTAMLFYITRKHRMQLNTEHVWLSFRLYTSYFRQTNPYAFR